MQASPEARMRASTAFLIMAPMVIVTLLFVGTQGRRAGAAGGGGGQPYWDEGVAAFVRQRMGSTYVDPLDAKASEAAFWRAMDAYVRLDPYCDMIPPSEYRQWKEGTSGHYGGLGIRVDAEAEGLRVRGVLPGGPAQRAGLQVGELVLGADGRALGGMDLRSGTPARLLKGAPGSSVRLEVRAASGEVRVLVATREVVRPPAVFTRRVGPQGKVAVLRLSEFVESTPAEVDEALAALLSVPTEGLVLDLRDNAGGVLAAAVHVADRFLPAGLVVRVVGRAAGTSRDFHAKASDDAAEVPAGLPVAVLVNGHSASASEVVSGALQDHRRALLVGERTFGKFLVQSIVEAPRGDCALQLVTARYVTPSGRSYQRRLEDGPPGPAQAQEGVDARGEPAGLLPDVVQALSAEERKRLLQHWDHEEDARWGAPPRHAGVTEGWVDPQLARALEVLEGELLMQRIRPGASPAR